MDRNTQQNLERLEAVLTQSIERQRQVAQMLDRKRLALRSGDTATMEDLCQLQAGVVRTVGELERQRVELVAQIAGVIEPGAAQAMNMKDLAERLPEPWRGRLLVLRARLVEAMQQVQEQTSVARRASEALLGHVNGLMRTIGVAARGGAAYAQTGRLHTRNSGLSSINVTA